MRTWDDGTAGGPEPVGSVAEEAAKLLDAVQDWAREHAHVREGAEEDEPGEAAAESAGPGAAGEPAAGHGPLRDGCRWCPLCQLAARLRLTSPEVAGHLQAAGTSLLRAAAAALDTPPSQATTRSAHDPGSDADVDRSRPWDQVDLDDPDPPDQ